MGIFKAYGFLFQWWRFDIPHGDKTRRWVREEEMVYGTGYTTGGSEGAEAIATFWMSANMYDRNGETEVGMCLARWKYHSLSTSILLEMLL
jgi:hypothetical protein